MDNNEHKFYFIKNVPQINFSLLLIFILFPTILSKITRQKTLIYSWEITIKIEGTGYKAILSGVDIANPSQIVINGQSQGGAKALNLNTSPTTIKIIWYSSPTTCNRMFADLSNLLYVDLSNFDSSQVDNMNQMFAACISLTSINFNGFDTSSVTRMYQMFLNCKSLETLDLRSFNTRSVNNMFNLFTGCENLRTINLSSFITSSVTEMNEMFKDCHSLTSLDLRNFDTSKVDNFANFFQNCYALETIDLSSFDTSKSYIFGNMFSQCHSLKSLNLSSFDSSNVAYMDNMFNGCNSLESLDLSNFDTSKAQVSHNLFKDCYKLKSLDISNFDTSKVNDMNNMFYNCYSLTSLELGNFDTSKVTDMSNMFYNCFSLTSLNLNSFSILKANSYSNMFFNITNLKYCINDEVDNIKNQLTPSDKLNCSELCSKDSTNKFIQEKNKCISHCTLDDTYNLEHNNICYQTCPIKTHLINDYYCEDDLICDKYYNYNHTACLDEIPLGYYLNDTINKTIDKCLIKCSNCTIGSVLNNLCVSCNNNEYYYPKLNDNINENSYIDCYNGEQIGYFLDNEQSIYKPCYSRCKTCIRGGNNVNHQCNECINSTYLLDDNGNCNEIPVITTIVIIPETTIIINPETTIINPETTIINPETTIINNINFKYNPSDSDLEKIQYCNGSVYSYNIKSNLTELKQKYNNVTFVNILGNNYDFLYEKFNLNKEIDNIYVVIVDYLCNDNNIVTSDYKIRFFLENNTELNLSNIKEDIYIDHYIPIKNSEAANLNYSKILAEQGYDIYNKSSDFYNDFCSPANIGDNDITLSDRKKYIYPNNATLCKDNCIYNGVDLEKEIIICSCNLNSDIKEDTENEDTFIEDDGNFITYFLDKVNYNIFKCYKLLSSFNNLEDNYSFYAISALFVIILALNFTFVFYSIPSLRHLMLKKVIRKEELLKNMTKKKRKNTLDNPPLKAKTQKLTIIRKKNSKKKLQTINVRINNIIKFPKIPSHKNKKRNVLKGVGKYIHNSTSNFIPENKLNIDDEQLNELPYNKAIKVDNRSLIKMFYSIIIKKIEIINLFCGKEKIKIILICEYLLSFLFNFFFNAFLYSDEVVSNKYHNNGELDIFVTLVLSILSNIITSIFCYYINYSKGIEEREELIQELRIEFHYLKNVSIFIKYLKLKFIFFFICEIILISGCFYYIVIFCIVYSRSRDSLMINYIYSLVEGLITSIAISIIILITRKIGLSFLNKYLYNTSKYINNKF